MTDKEAMKLIDAAEKAAREGDPEKVRYIQAKLDDEMDKLMVGSLIETAEIYKAYKDEKE